MVEFPRAGLLWNSPLAAGLSRSSSAMLLRCMCGLIRRARIVAASDADHCALRWLNSWQTNSTFPLM